MKWTSYWLLSSFLWSKYSSIVQLNVRVFLLIYTSYLRWPSEVHLESSLEDDATLQETEKKDKDDSELFADEPIENVSSITWIDSEFIMK